MSLFFASQLEVPFEKASYYVMVSFYTDAVLEITIAPAIGHTHIEDIAERLSREFMLALNRKGNERGLVIGDDDSSIIGLAPPKQDKFMFVIEELPESTGTLHEILRDTAESMHADSI